jgi:predicted metalloprotease with PDZ domain
MTGSAHSNFDAVSVKFAMQYSGSFTVNNLQRSDMKKIAFLATLIWAVCGCATQIVEKNANDSCASQGKKAFIFEAKQSGVPLLIESASAMILCVGPDDVTPLPASFGADAVSAANFAGAGILTVSAGSVAEKAGVKAGDIVIEFAGSPIANARELSSYIELVSAGSQVIVKVRRSAKDVVTTARF